MRLFLNMDCMEGMKEYPDDCFDLAIVDPPYGGAGVDTTIEELGYDYVGYEIDETYYELAKKRLDDFNAQIRMF